MVLGLFCVNGESDHGPGFKKKKSLGKKKERWWFFFLLPDVFESMAVQVAVVAPLQGGVTQPAAGNGGSNRQRWLSLLLPPSHGMREEPHSHFLE